MILVDLGRVVIDLFGLAFVIFLGLFAGHCCRMREWRRTDFAFVRLVGAFGDEVDPVFLLRQRHLISSRFFSRAAAPHFAFLDFFAAFNLPVGLTEIMQRGTTPLPLILACALPPPITRTADTTCGTLCGLTNINGSLKLKTAAAI
jgi:hypothetical protein